MTGIRFANLVIQSANVNNPCKAGFVSKKRTLMTSIYLYHQERQIGGKFLKQYIKFVPKCMLGTNLEPTVMFNAHDTCISIKLC